MSKTAKLWIIIHLIFLATFNTIFFILKGTDNPASVWISYGAIHLAYILVWFIRFFRLKEASLFGISSVMIMHGYLYLQIFVGLLFIAFSPEGWKFAFILQLMILAVSMSLFLISTIAGKHASDGKPMLDELTKAAMTTDYIKLAKTNLDILQRGTLDMDIKKYVVDVLDVFNSGVSQEKNTQKLQDLSFVFSSAVGRNDIIAIESAKADLIAYIKE